MKKVFGFLMLVLPLLVALLHLEALSNTQWNDSRHSDFLSLSGSTCVTYAMSGNTAMSIGYSVADANAQPAGRNTNYDVWAYLGCSADINTSTIPDQQMINTSVRSGNAYSHSISRTASVISYKKHPVIEKDRSWWNPFAGVVTRSFSHSESAYYTVFGSTYTQLETDMVGSIEGNSNQFLNKPIGSLNLSRP